MKQEDGAAATEARDFGLGLALFLALLSAGAYFRSREDLVSPLALASALAAGLALLWPLPLAPFSRAAMAAAGVIGWINTRLLLGLVFYLVLAPMALVLRLLGRDLLDRKWEPGRDSYWRPRPEEGHDPEKDERQF